jgi:hypothetical protein
MIVQRITYTLKPGCMQEAVAMVTAEIEKEPPPHAVRVYSPGTGSWDEITLEFEFESVAQSDEHWEQWLAKPGTTEYLAKFNELMTPPTRSEFRNITEFNR